MTLVENITQTVEKMPNEIQLEILDFVNYLKNKRMSNKNVNHNAGLHFKWAGKLKSYKKEFSSVELQHESLDWR